MNRQDAEAFMREALAEAEGALSRGEAPVGAVVVRNGAIIARAGNWREAQNDPAAHAELIALREAARALGDWRLTDCTLLVTLEPCAMCAGAILAARVAEVFYGAQDAAAGCCGSVYDLPADPALGGKIPSTGGILREQAEALLRAFPRGGVD